MKYTGVVFKDNSKQIINDPNSFTVFIENKLSLEKVHVDEKMIMYDKFINVLNLSRSKSTQISNDFCKDMIDTYNVNTFPLSLVLLFAAENISIELRKYIENINTGNITETDYKNITYSLLLDNQSYKDFYEALTHYVSTLKPSQPTSLKKFFYQFKRSRYEIKSYDDVVSIVNELKRHKTYLDSNNYDFNDEKYENFRHIVVTFERCVPYIERFITNYTTLKTYFNKLKGKIGYITDGRIHADIIFTECTPLDQ
jgi:hypothetical protein